MEKISYSKVIEVTVISAEGLLVNKKQPVKKNNVHVVVRTDPTNSRSTGTNPDCVGGMLTWNEKLGVMELPVHARYVTVEARSGSKVVGAANVPVSDFVGGHLPENYLSLLSYRMRDGRGVKNGIVNLSVKVSSSGVNVAAGCAASCSRPWMGVPVGGADKGQYSSGGVVTGVPVAYRY